MMLATETKVIFLVLVYIGTEPQDEFREALEI